MNSSVAIIVMGLYIQGAGLRPAAYLFNAADLRPLRAEKDITKFADDT